MVCVRLMLLLIAANSSYCRSHKLEAMERTFMKCLDLNDLQHNTPEFTICMIQLISFFIESRGETNSNKESDEDLLLTRFTQKCTFMLENVDLSNPAFVTATIQTLDDIFALELKKDDTKHKANFIWSNVPVAYLVCLHHP